DSESKAMRLLLPASRRIHAPPSLGRSGHSTAERCTCQTTSVASCTVLLGNRAFDLDAGSKGSTRAARRLRFGRETSTRPSFRKPGSGTDCHQAQGELVARVQLEQSGDLVVVEVRDEVRG